MLASTETIAAVAEALEARDFGSLVVDPVMVATTGAELLPPEALRELRARLLPRATVLTPNIPEARLLLADAGLGDVLPDKLGGGVADLEAAGRALLSLGPEWVLVKGGHAPLRRRDYAAAGTDAERELVVDVLCGKDGCVRIETDFQTSRNTHGTGCSLACESPIFPMSLGLLQARLREEEELTGTLLQLPLRLTLPRACQSRRPSRLRVGISSPASRLRPGWAVETGPSTTSTRPTRCPSHRECYLRCLRVLPSTC